MTAEVLNGTWEEISLHAAALAGKTLRLTILTDQTDGDAVADASLTTQTEVREALRKIMARQVGIRETTVFRLASFTEGGDK